jgi:hypothetical protein
MPCSAEYQLSNDKGGDGGDGGPSRWDLVLRTSAVVSRRQWVEMGAPPYLECKVGVTCVFSFNFLLELVESIEILFEMV